MLVEMGSENQSSVRPGELELGIDGGRKSCVSGNSSNIKSDSFVVEMDRFSLPVEKDINGCSRITLQRNLSRKGSGKCGEKKINSILGANERDACMLSTSPRATLHGSSTPEKPTVVVALGATDHSTTHQPHHQITINGSMSNTAAESKCGKKKFSFQRFPPSFTVDPRRILYLFATLSYAPDSFVPERCLNLLRGKGQMQYKRRSREKRNLLSRGVLSVGSSIAFLQTTFLRNKSLN